MRSEESFGALLRSILTCKVISVASLTIEQNLQDRELSQEQRANLVSLQSLRSLDEIHILTSEKLEQKKSYPKPNLDYLLLDE